MDLDSDDEIPVSRPAQTRPSKGKGRAILSSDDDSDSMDVTSTHNVASRSNLPQLKQKEKRVQFNAQSKAKGKQVITGLNDRGGEEGGGGGVSREQGPMGLMSSREAEREGDGLENGGDDDERPAEDEEPDEDDDIGSAPGKRRKTADQSYAWEASYTRSWDVVQEDEAGGLQAAVEGLMMRGRRRRAQSSQASLRRSIIRHTYILLDLSISMNEKDMRPTRWDLTLQYLRSFVVEWFDQNPLGQIGVIGLRNGLAEMIIEVGGNPNAILTAIADKRKLEPSGEPSLQNGLEMARSSMNHLPSTSSLEILVLFSSLTTTDPGSIHKTLSKLLSSRIRVSIIALAAELKICRLITEKTQGKFGVALNEAHYRELLFELVQAPATTTQGTLGLKSAMDSVAKRVAGRPGGGPGKAPPSDLMMMGFPTRLPLSGAGAVGLCACHGLIRRGGYLCPRCGAKACEVPTDCEVCGLMVVSSPHLARSYWFLFPVPKYGTIPYLDEEDSAKASLACFGCNVPFPEVDGTEMGVAQVEEGISPTGRYRCPKCVNDFCENCDLFIHEVLKSCPGCAAG